MEFQAKALKRSWANSASATHRSIMLLTTLVTSETCWRIPVMAAPTSAVFWTEQVRSRLLRLVVIGRRRGRDLCHDRAELLGSCHERHAPSAVQTRRASVQMPRRKAARWVLLRPLRPQQRAGTTRLKH